MQSPIFEPANLPELPKSGLIDQWVFESPIPLALGCLGLAVIAFGILRTTQHAKRIGVPILILGLMLAGAILLAGFLVTTDAERLKAQSRALVVATANADESTLEPLLDEQVRVQTRFVSQSGKARILALASSRASPIIESVSVKEVRVGLYGPQVARTQIKVKVQGDMIPPLSWWTLDWTRPSPESDDWVVTHIEPLWIQGVTNPAGSK